MSSFWRRFARINAAFVIEQLQQLIPGPPIGVVVIFRTRGAVAMGEITVVDTETTLRSTLTPVDAEGNETTLESPPTYESSDEGVATVTPSDDGLTATYEVGGPGSAVITVHTGVNDSDGNEILGLGTIHVTPGPATTVSLEFEVG